MSRCESGSESSNSATKRELWNLRWWFLHFFPAMCDVFVATSSVSSFILSQSQCQVVCYLVFDSIQLIGVFSLKCDVDRRPLYLAKPKSMNLRSQFCFRCYWGKFSSFFLVVAFFPCKSSELNDAASRNEMYRKNRAEQESSHSLLFVISLFCKSQVTKV